MQETPVNRLPHVSCCFSILVAALASPVPAADVESVTEHCLVERGPINGAVIRSRGQQLAVYGWDDGPIDRLLLTHGRRDVIWRATAAAEKASIIAPAREKYSLEKGTEFWVRFPETTVSRLRATVDKDPERGFSSCPMGRWR